MGKRTGLFGRQLKDELKESYHHDQDDNNITKETVTKSEKRKSIFYKGGPDRVIEIVVLGLIIIFALFLLFTWKHLFN